MSEQKISVEQLLEKLDVLVSRSNVHMGELHDDPTSRSASIQGNLLDTANREFLEASKGFDWQAAREDGVKESVMLRLAQAHNRAEKFLADGGSQGRTDRYIAENGGVEASISEAAPESVIESVSVEQLLEKLDVLVSRSNVHMGELHDDPTSRSASIQGNLLDTANREFLEAFEDFDPQAATADGVEYSDMVRLAQAHERAEKFLADGGSQGRTDRYIAENGGVEAPAADTTVVAEADAPVLDGNSADVSIEMTSRGVGVLTINGVEHEYRSMGAQSLGNVMEANGLDASYAKMANHLTEGQPVQFSAPLNESSTVVAEVEVSEVEVDNRYEGLPQGPNGLAHVAYDTESVSIKVAGLELSGAEAPKTVIAEGFSDVVMSSGNARCGCSAPEVIANIDQAPGMNVDNNVQWAMNTQPGTSFA